jgi:outer membrane protein
MKRTVLVVSALLVATGLSFAQAMKLAFVDSEVILRELPEAQKAQQDLEALVKTWQEELEKMGQNLQKELEEYQKKEALYNPQKKEEEQRRLAEIQQKAREYQYQKFDPRVGEAATEREKRLAPIRDKILKSIEDVAREEGFSFVFDKANDVVLLYADTKFNLTYKVLDRLKRGPTTTTGKN